MRVLLTTGGQGQTEIAIRQFMYLAESIAIKPTVLTVIKRAEDRTKGEEILADAARQLDPAFETVEYKIRVGQPWEEIVKEGEEGNYDLIMMGQRKSRPLLSRLRGLVTQKVVSHTNRPVLIAKREARPFNRILICDSGVQAPSLPKLFQLRLPEILAGASEVVVLHVMSQISAAPGVKGEDLYLTTEQLMATGAPEGTFLEQSLAHLEDIGPQLQARVRHGLVLDEIVKEARSDDYDLVAIGARRDDGVPRFLLDDLAHELVLDVDRAILVVR